jgi:outer membrane protein TolC
MKTMAGVDQTIVPTASPETAEVPVTATVREDPELHALDLRIEALRTAVALANPLWQPSVAAQVQFSRLFDRFRRYYNNFKPNDLSAGVTITLPLWTGGRRAAAAARLTAQLDQLIAGREARRAQLDLANRETTSELHDAQEERVLAERTLDVARESLRVAGQLEAEGRGEVNAVPEAQIAVADAEEDLANADAQVRTVTWRLRFLQKELPHPPL